MLIVTIKVSQLLTDILQQPAQKKKFKNQMDLKFQAEETVVNIRKFLILSILLNKNKKTFNMKSN
jgi:hypothetical protein